MRPAWTRFEVGAIAVITAAGAMLRAWHVDGPSLWWDELIHIGTASQPTLAEVVRRVRLGSPPGAGNAGAVPLDYLLLHLWQRLAPFPDPHHLEAYFRFPALVFSAATPLALHAWVRRWAGAAAGLAAAACVAGTPIHMAYAVEARFYALFALMTVANLASFTRVLHRRDLRAYGVFGLVGVLYFLTGLFGVLVLAVEFLVLAVGVGRRWARRHRHPEAWRPAEAAGLLATALVVGAAPVAYYWNTTLAVTARTRRPPIDVWSVTLGGLWDYASESPVIAALLGVGVLAAAWRARRGRLAPALVVTVLAVGLGLIPAIAAIERWKRYYFHARHALFVLPALAALVGIGAAAVAQGLAGRRSRVILALAPAVVALALAPRAAEYVRRPESVLWRTKTLRELDPVLEDLAVQLAAAPPDAKVLLVAPRYGRGSLTNPIVQRYIEWWGLADRVVFRGSGILATTLTRIRETCGTSCRGRPGGVLERAIAAHGPPFVFAPHARVLLGLTRPRARWPGRVAGVVVLDYDNLHRVAVPLGFRGPALRGLRVWQLPDERGPWPSTPPAASRMEG